VYMGVTVLTKLRRRTSESSEAQEDSTGRPVEDDGDTCRQWGMRMEYATCGGFRGFGPQNPGGGYKERTTRGGIREFALSRSYR